MTKKKLAILQVAMFATVLAGTGLAFYVTAPVDPAPMEPRSMMFNV